MTPRKTSKDLPPRPEAGDLLSPALVDLERSKIFAKMAVALPMKDHGHPEKPESDKCFHFGDYKLDVDVQPLLCIWYDNLCRSLA